MTVNVGRDDENRLDYVIELDRRIVWMIEQHLHWVNDELQVV
jgi:hypothetical protein